MAFSITSRFNMLATTQISLTLTRNAPGENTWHSLPFPEFPLGPQCIPEADEFKLVSKSTFLKGYEPQTWPFQLSFLTTPSWCLDGFPIQESSLVIDFITNKWGNHNLRHLLPLKSLPLLLWCNLPQKASGMQILVCCWTLLLLAPIIEGWEKINPYVRYVCL